MQKFILKKIIRRILREEVENREKYYFDYQSFLTIKLIVESRDLEELTPFISSLLQDDKRVFLWVWCPKNFVLRETIPGVEDTVFMTTKETIPLLHIPRNEVCLQFLNRPVEVLCDFTQSPKIQLAYLVALSRATMKIGQHDLVSGLYDFKINDKTTLSVKNLAQNILFYWKRIDRKNNNL